MKLGIMQPYFMPYIGYFALVKYCDKWIIFDDIQYIERGWVNRNRIIHPNKCEDVYISIPLEKHSRSIFIKDVKINKNTDYINKILGQVKAAYKKRAPYFKEVYELLEEILNYNTEYLSELNVYSMKKVCEYLNIDFKYEIFSQMNLEIDTVNDPGEWALNISKSLKASEYINPTGGTELFDKEKFNKNNIKLKFLKPNLKEYNQRKSSFIEGLSIIDVMMFNDKNEINKMLDDYEIIE